MGVAQRSAIASRVRRDMSSDDWRDFCRDTKRSLTPGGRPARKPRRIVMRLNESQHRSASEFYVMERPTMSAGIGLERCMQSRPPLKIEALSHPSPCTYTLPWSSLTTRGVIRQSINPRYSRDALPYRAKGVWTYSLDDDRLFPSPCSYTLPHSIGSSSPYKPAAPSYTICQRNFASLGRRNAAREPAPNSYSREEASIGTLPRAPAYSIAPSRADKRTVNTPGPAHYSPLHKVTKHKSPSFTM